MGEQGAQSAMIAKALELLKTYYGYTTFKRGQEQVIQSILDHRDTLGVMPTGSGKSVCYQIPALILEGVIVVISPLISLMKDQVDAPPRIIQHDICQPYSPAWIIDDAFHRLLYVWRHR